MASIKEIDQWIGQTDSLNITITMPTHVKGEDVQQNPIRFKNLLTQAEEKLKNQGLKTQEIDQLLEEPRSLLDNFQFWNHTEEGLVIFVNSRMNKRISVPYNPGEQVYVQDHFLITPLLPLISLDGTFSILALDRKSLSLLRCTRKSVREITPDDIFTNIEDFLEDNPQTHLQFHTGASKEDSIFFSHGGSEEDKSQITLKYFRGVEESVTSTMSDLGEPLILAGTDEIIHLYQSINRYKRTVETSIKGYPGDLNHKELQLAGWDIIQEYFLKDMYRAIEEFKDENSSKISNNLTEIIESTVMGKTATLFISRDEQAMGFYDDANHTVHYSGKNDEDDHELLNWTALKTLDQGGKVFVLPKQEMPHHATVAALFRF